MSGGLVDCTPAPGNTYTRDTWPPRGRGRGESLISPRRIKAKLRAIQVIKLRMHDHTWDSIARSLGFKDASGPYRAYKRITDRVDWDKARTYELWKERMGLTDADVDKLRSMMLDDDNRP